MLNHKIDVEDVKDIVRQPVYANIASESTPTDRKSVVFFLPMKMFHVSINGEIKSTRSATRAVK